jgi:hypothetical protein
MTPSDAELLSVLPGAATLERRPFPYATTCPLTELTVGYPDGGSQRLLLKSLRPQRPRPGGYHPEREGLVYADVLAGTGYGPALIGAGADWILIELVDGTELWQIGDVEAWAAVGGWLGDFHRCFAARREVLARLLPVLDLRQHWPHNLTGFDLAACHEMVAPLTDLPRTLVHGEFYPSNVLVSGDRVIPVDWETAGLGPGVLDLAALVTGWDDASVARIVRAHGGVAAIDVDRARLALALRWLGAEQEWQPPAEHRHDWLAEARGALERLEQ